MKSVIDLSKLETLVKSLNASLDWVGTAIVVATGLVVIGLLVEYLDDFQKVWSAVVGCFRYKSFLRLKYLDRKVKEAFIGGILVTVGVAGEFWFEYKASTIQGDLQAANGKIVAFLNAKASQADDRARSSQKESEQLRRDAEELKKATEDERLARVKIEEGIAWRRLTKSQEQELASVLAPFKNQVASIHGAGDSESLTFAWGIGTALHEARWNVYPLSSSGLSISVPWGEALQTGITIRSSADEKSLDSATALARALVERGFDAVLAPTRETPPPHVAIEVHVRPEGPQGAAKLRAQSNKKRGRLLGLVNYIIT